MTDINLLINEQAKINSDAEFEAFIEKYRLVKDVPGPTISQVLGIYRGQVDGHQVVVRFRWYDGSHPFENLPDVHCVRLTIDGKDLGEQKFDDI